MADGKGSWREKRRGFFRKGLRGTVPHRPPSQAWVRRCAARQGRSWRISRTRLASASLNPPPAVLGSAPTADPHNPLMGEPGPGKSGSEGEAKWPGQQGHKPGTSELFLGRRSGAERGQVPTEGGTGALEDTATKPLDPGGGRKDGKTKRIREERRQGRPIRRQRRASDSGRRFVP